MNKKEIPVLVRMSGSARNQQGQLEDTMQLRMPGKLEKRASDWVLSYQEIIEDEADHSRVIHDVYVQVRDDKVVMLRKGPYGMMMVLEPGKRYETSYHTPYGNMEMAVYPLLVQSDMSEQHGKINMEYSLDIAGGFASVRKMALEYSATTGSSTC